MEPAVGLAGWYQAARRLQPYSHFLGSCGAEASFGLWPGPLGCLCPLPGTPSRSKQSLLSKLCLSIYLANYFSSDAFFGEKALTNH